MAIVADDLAEVLGTIGAFNLLFGLPCSGVSDHGL